jgi:hypothetical protein
MRKSCLYSQNLVRVIIFTAALVGMVRPLVAQQDFQVLVVGPWSYVSDASNKQLFLVTPSSKHHHVYIYSGQDIRTWTSAGMQSKKKAPGVYTLGFDAGFHNGTSINAPLEDPIVCGASIGDPSAIKAVLANSGNDHYVISLPMPDLFSTYSDTDFIWDGYSESKVAATPVTEATAPSIYTTAMVLHYWAQSIPDHLLLNNSPISTTEQGGGTNPGITIVTGDPNPKDDDRMCDTISLESVSDRNGLWQINQYARFPEELDLEGHQTHHYRYTCPTAVLPSRLTERQELLCTASGGIVKGDLCLEAAGSADCHACQMSINGAVTGAIIPVIVSK